MWLMDLSSLPSTCRGQLGIGALASVEVVPTPSEIVLARSYPGGITVKCTNIAAGVCLGLTARLQKVQFDIALTLRFVGK